MKLELQTERLFLRPLSLDDLDLTIEMFTDPDVTRYVRQVDSSENITNNLPRYIRRCGGGCIGVWCVMDKHSHEKLGTAVLVPVPVKSDEIDWERIEGPDIPTGDIEIGYILKKSAWGKGYATEAAERLLRFAFEDTPLREVAATIDDDNDNSRKVLKKIGFRETGKQLAYGKENCPFFRISHEQWLSHRAAG